MMREDFQTFMVGVGVVGLLVMWFLIGLMIFK